MAKKKNHRLEHVLSTLHDYEKRLAGSLYREFTVQETLGDRVADWVAAVGGSWSFVFGLSAFLGLWMVWNALSWTSHPDPYPFILLNLILSCLSAFQAPLIMMSQNHQSTRSALQATMDFAINIKAEEEVEDMQQHLHTIERNLAALTQQFERVQEELRRLTPSA